MLLLVLDPLDTLSQTQTSGYNAEDESVGEVRDVVRDERQYRYDDGIEAGSVFSQNVNEAAHSTPTFPSTAVTVVDRAEISATMTPYFHLSIARMRASWSARVRIVSSLVRLMRCMSSRTPMIWS